MKNLLFCALLILLSGCEQTYTVIRCSNEQTGQWETVRFNYIGNAEYMGHSVPDWFSINVSKEDVFNLALTNKEICQISEETFQ